MTSFLARANAALGNAGYSQGETGEWEIVDCAVTLSGTGYEAYWTIEIRSAHGTISSEMTVKDIRVKRAAPKAAR